MVLALVLLPLIAGGVAFVLRSNTLRLTLLVIVALVHAGLVALCWMNSPASFLSGWMAVDSLGLLFLTLVSLLFLCTALYAIGYLQHEPDCSNRVFVGCLLVFLASMSLVTLSRHLGLLWVAIEATTLASAPLIYFHHSQRSLEATWKYLLICSVGIALALLGTFFLALAGSDDGGSQLPLLLDTLVAHAGKLHVPWLKGAFLLCLVGYGTKMGLAPLHTWLPDAHSEAPSPVSALLSGALLNCAFLGILRFVQICQAAGLGPFAQELLVVFGMISLLVAAVFIVGQADYKRMLAYSSVEHMGILSLGVGLGQTATYGAMLHAVNHSLTKALLFLAAGNVLLAYGTKSANNIRGVLRSLPLSGWVLLGGFFAITGSPPFGPFLSEFIILNAAIAKGNLLLAATYLGLLATIFLGMGAIILPMMQGEANSTSLHHKYEDSWLMAGVPLVLLALVLTLGLYVPPEVREALTRAAQLVGGSV
jgi:hydrogenase-4 component F